MADHTLLHVVCQNPDCVHFERVRSVRMPHLGDGVYARPSLACECNPSVDMRYATSTKDGEIYDELVLLPALVPTEPPC